MKFQSLNGPWKFRVVKGSALPSRLSRIHRWMDADVPGTVHTDLLANRIIPDPFYRMNELDVRWVEDQQWLYRKAFVAGNSILEEERIYLVAEGLDTFADIRLNGKRIAATSNMFIGHRFDVTGKIRRGRNIL